MIEAKPTNYQIDQLSTILGQAAKAIKKINYRQNLSPDDVPALSQAYDCLHATCAWFYQRDDKNSYNFPDAWVDNIVPALEAIAPLLNYLAGNTNTPLTVLASYVKLPQAIEALEEVRSTVASELFDAQNESYAAMSLAKKQFQQYERALISAIDLFKEAYDYITTRYGYNASITHPSRANHENSFTNR